MAVEYRHFRAGALTSWDSLFSDVRDFAQTLGSKALIAITHSADRSEGVATVWYRGHAGHAAGRERLAYRMFRASSFTPWETLFAQAAECASTVGAHKVAAISHSSDHADGIVVVWYWD